MKRPKRPFEDTVAAACDAAAKLLARREHAARELDLKLAQRGFSPPVRDEALEELRRRDWLNEARFAQMLARHRAAQGKGPRWVQAELQAAGVPAPLQQEALQQPDIDWFDACGRALRRLPDQELEARQRQKLYQRGFEAQQIDAVIAVHAGDSGI